jgi:hypothetical protein
VTRVGNDLQFAASEPRTYGLNLCASLPASRTPASNEETKNPCSAPATRVRRRRRSIRWTSRRVSC